VAAKTTNGAVTVRRATGTLDLTTSYNRIDVDAPCTAVTARNASGAIAVKGAKGPLSLRSSNGAIETDAAGAEVEAQTTNGPVTIRGAKGRVSAKTSYAKLDIHAEEAAVTAENASGAIAFAGSLARGDHSFRSSNGAISLTLPARAGFSVDAQTSYGKIINRFALKATTTAKDTRLVGQVGDDPDATIRAHTSNADVVLQPAR